MVVASLDFSDDGAPPRPCGPMANQFEDCTVHITIKGYNDPLKYDDDNGDD